MDGYIKLYRELLEKPIWLNSTPEQKTILIALLLMANHKKKSWEWKGEKFNVSPGQFVTSLNSIQKICGKGISGQNIRTALNRFKKLEFLTNKSTKMGRVITIMNWDSYQPKNKKLTKILTDGSQRPNKDLTPNKNVRKKECKNNIDISKDIPVGEKTSPTICPQIKIRELYNTILSQLPQCKSTNKTVESYVRTRWKEDTSRQSLEWWNDYFEQINKSDFLTGKTQQNFLATFEWVVRPTNMSKILNGNYDNRDSNKKPEKMSEYFKRKGLNPDGSERTARTDR